MKPLETKTIIITGGSLGIGLAVAKKCADNGARVIIVARNANDLANALTELNQISEDKHLSYPLDVSNIEAVQEFKNWLQTNDIEINGLINCAGIYGPIGKTTEVDMQKFTQAIQVNFLGTVYMCNAIAPIIKSNSRKKIINFAGGGAASPFPNYSAYATSKVAIVRFTENLALELANENFDINCIAPGFVITRLHEQTIEAAKNKICDSFLEATKKQIETGGTSPEVAANLAVFLLSDESDRITGKFISAPWDPWTDKEFQNKLKEDNDLASLRRIDNKTFFKQPKKNKVAIIGCGLIGKKRALALDTNDEIVACCAQSDTSATKFASEFSCKPYTDYRKLLDEVACDTVVVAVINKYAQEIVCESLKRGKHVLAEKPLGRNASEANAMLLEQKQASEIFNKKIILKTGFNHRFHPALWKAKELVDAGEIGTIMTIRARYGHGGRPGMENEWRASKDECGGGELLDQGVHIIDLARWFAGDIKHVQGNVQTKFWPMHVEDNAFVHMKSETNVDIQFHVSWTNWKNIFSFEIFGTDGYLAINGLGGSYGPETLEFGKRNKEGGKPIIETFSFAQIDISWEKEWAEFKAAIKEQREPIGSGLDGFEANKIIEAIYESNKKQNDFFISNTKQNEKHLS